MHQLLHIVWNPEIEAFSIFGITIRYYSILFVTGLILAYWVISKLYKDQKIPYEKFDSLFIYCLLGIVVGARLGHCLFYEPSYWLSHPLEMIQMDRLSRFSEPRRNHRIATFPLVLCPQNEIKLPFGTRQHCHCHPYRRLFYPFGQLDEWRDSRQTE